MLSDTSFFSSHSKPCMNQQMENLVLHPMAPETRVEDTSRAEEIRHPSSSRIPRQMQRRDLVFVMVPAGEKGPVEKGWNKVSSGRQYDDPLLSLHLEQGGNYGYYPAPGSHLLSLDVDNAAAFHAAGGEALVSGTFQYSAWTDRHKYRAIVSCPDIPAHFFGHKVSVRDEAYQTIVELFFPAGLEKAGGQCIGPGSRHPNGTYYTVYSLDAPIRNLSWADITALVTKVSPEVPETPRLEIPAPKQHGRSITERYGLSVMNNPPLQPRLCGDEIRGVHPVHGSTSPGGNIAMNPSKGVVYCFRCGKGYDAAQWDAICRGIMPCGGIYDRSVMKEHLDQLNREMPEVRFLERIAWKRAGRGR